MLGDGREIAKKVYEDVAGAVATLPRLPKLCAVTCAPNFETKSYLELKKRRAKEAGIALNVIELPEDAQTEDVIACIERIAPETDGIVVQLPLPAHVDKEAVLAAVPAQQDPDGFSYGVHEAACLSPVAAAIDEISATYDVAWDGTSVVILGHGRLVGKPAAVYAAGRGREVTVLTEESADIAKRIADADILITGVGKPQLVTADMLKPGVVVFDAGTSEDGGELVGDVAPAAAEVASLITPVPGGIGPITVACLLRNLVYLVRQECGE